MEGIGTLPNRRRAAVTGPSSGAGRVVVVGSANVDLAVRMPHLPVPGQTVLGGELEQRPGGKGANQAVAAARAGARTAFLGAVGEDGYGAALRTALRQSGVDVEQLRTVEAATGVALVLSDAHGENTIVVAPGANARLSRDDLGGLAALLGPAAVLLVQLEVPLDTVTEAVRIASRTGARVVLNAAPAPAAAAELLPLLPSTDVLVVNAVEAAALGAVPASDGWPAAADRLRSLGPAAVVVTLGGAGAVVADAAGTDTIPAVPVEVVDTTGAGDAFCGALAAELAAGAPIRDAVRAGCRAGAAAAATPGAQGSSQLAAASC